MSISDSTIWVLYCKAVVVGPLRYNGVWLSLFWYTLLLYVKDNSCVCHSPDHNRSLVKRRLRQCLYRNTQSYDDETVRLNSKAAMNRANVLTMRLLAV